VVNDVRRANLELYRAFESLDLARMDAAWAHEGQVTCVHPGWPLADGWPAVRRSWETIFRNTKDIRFEIRDEKIDVQGDLAWVVCVERVRSGGGEGRVLATNVLRRGPDGWRVVHHHGSPLPAPQPPPPPTKRGGGKKVMN
jgi:ketosteroid isomerase-like protein